MSSSNKVVKAITGVACVMLLAKALGMVRSILQARALGAGADMDAFVLANNYSIYLFTTVAYALCVAAIPIFSKKLLEGKEACYKTANQLITNTVVLSLALTVLLTLAWGSGLIQAFVGVADNVPLFQSCYLVFLLTLPVITLTYLLLSLFQSMGHFTLQPSLSLLYNLALCAVLFLWRDTLTVSSFALITAVCWLLQLAMILPSVVKEKYRFRPCLNLRDRAYWSFLRTGMITMYNAALFLLCFLINTHFATGAAEGTVASLSYAEKLYDPLASALIYSISIVMFPKFSQQFASMERREYRQYVVYVVKNTLLLILPVSLLFAAFGTPVIKVLFEGGDFTPADTARCGAIFSMYAIGMAGFFILDLLNKAWYAMNRTLLPSLITTLGLALCVLLNGLSTKWYPDQPALLPLGTTVAFLVAGSLAYVVFARGEGERVKLPLKQLFWGLVLSLALGMGAWLLYDLFIVRFASKLLLVALCGAVGVVGMVLYLLLMGNMIPTREILGKLKKGESK